MSGEKLSGNISNMGDATPANTASRPEKSFRMPGKKAVAAVLAIASMVGAGCDKKKKDNKESRLPEDTTKQTMMSVDPSNFVPVDPNTVVSTDDVTVSIGNTTEPTFETREQNDLPEILEANPESVRNFYMYTPENTKVKPGINSQDYRLPEDLVTNLPDRPNGPFNLTKLCEDLGIDKSDIKILGGGEIVIGDENTNGVVITSDYKICYHVGGKLTHLYKSGKEGGGMSKDGMSLCVEDGDSYKHGASLHFSDTTIGVLELMLRAYAAGDANPFD